MENTSPLFSYYTNPEQEMPIATSSYAERVGEALRDISIEDDTRIVLDKSISIWYETRGAIEISPPYDSTTARDGVIYESRIMFVAGDEDGVEGDQYYILVMPKDKNIVDVGDLVLAYEASHFDTIEEIEHPAELKEIEFRQEDLSNEVFNGVTELVRRPLHEKQAALLASEMLKAAKVLGSE